MKEHIVNTVPASMCKGFSNTLVEQGLLIWGGRRVSGENCFSDKADCVTSAYGTKWNGNASAFNGSLFANTVGAQCAHMSRSGQDNQAVASGHVIPTNGVRRLTPLECERLQGLPDNYTLVDEKSSDTARYKAIGNGMAQPCADFILSVIRRMADD